MSALITDALEIDAIAVNRAAIAQARASRAFDPRRPYLDCLRAALTWARRRATADVTLARERARRAEMNPIEREREDLRHLRERISDPLTRPAHYGHPWAPGNDLTTDLARIDARLADLEANRHGHKRHSGAH